MKARRKDDNHNQITGVLRDVGAELVETYQIPGALDVFVAYRGRWTLLEIKDAAKTDSRRRLTDAEQATIARLARTGAPVHVVTTPDEALRAIGALNEARAA